MEAVDCIRQAVREAQGWEAPVKAVAVCTRQAVPEEAAEAAQAVVGLEALVMAA